MQLQHKKQRIIMKNLKTITLRVLCNNSFCFYKNMYTGKLFKRKFLDNYDAFISKREEYEGYILVI